MRLSAKNRIDISLNVVGRQSEALFVHHYEQSALQPLPTFFTDARFHSDLRYLCVALKSIALFR